MSWLNEVATCTCWSKQGPRKKQLDYVQLNWIVEAMQQSAEHVMPYMLTSALQNVCMPCFECTHSVPLGQ